MSRDFSIVGLRLLSIYIFVGLIAKAPFIPSFYNSVEEFGYAMFLSMAIDSFLSVFLWFRAEHIVKYITQGIVNGKDSALKPSEEICAAILCAAGFLIVSKSFYPASSFLSDFIFQKKSMKNISMKNINDFLQFLSLFLLGLFLVIKPATLWKIILKSRKI